MLYGGIKLTIIVKNGSQTCTINKFQLWEVSDLLFKKFAEKCQITNIFGERTESLKSYHFFP